MLDSFKKKTKTLDKLPYLSRSTNDLINYNYKKDKDRSDIIDNWMTCKNNYLNIIPKIKNKNTKRIHLFSNRNRKNDKSGLKMTSSLSVKSMDIKNNKNNELFIDKENKNIQPNEIDNIKNINNLEIMNDSTQKNNLNEESKIIYKEKYDKLNELSNQQVLKKIRSSIENPNNDYKEVIFPNYIDRKRENKIDLLFGKHSLK